MQLSNDASCSFCKKSDSNLVTHSLCEGCLVHSKCCDATTDKSISIAWEEDVLRKAKCDICLEEYQEDELQHHREMCMPRLVFRCSLCYEDYLSEESLWNHLIVHKIEDEDRELYYQEKRITYKQLVCILCNDQRSYQESSFWEHVHEDHDGFYLKCAECGENFRSKKHKAEHGLNHCKFKEQMIPYESDVIEIDDGYENTDITMVEQNGVLDEDFEANPEEKQSSLEPEAVDSVTLIIDSEDDTEEITQSDVESRSSKAPSEIRHKAEEGKTEKLQILARSKKWSASKQVDLRCPQCNKVSANAKALARHIEMAHEPATCNICGITLSTGNAVKTHKLKEHQGRKHPCSKCPRSFYTAYEYKRHLLVHEEKIYFCDLCNFKSNSKASLDEHIQGFHQKQSCKIRTQKSYSIKTDCPICRENFSDQNQVALHVEGIHKMAFCTVCRVTFNNADALQKHKCSMCPHCGKKWSGRTRLKFHIELVHDKITCGVCGISFEGTRKLKYHKKRKHSDQKIKCPRCSKIFYFKFAYTRHKAFCLTTGNSFPCKLCGCRYDSIVAFTTHLRMKHDLLRTHDEIEEENTNQKENIVDVQETSLLMKLLKSEDHKPQDQSERSVTLESETEDNTVKDVANNLPMEGVHRRRQKYSDGFPCKFCDRKFQRLVDVQHHIRRMHAVKKRSRQTSENQNHKKCICVICGDSFVNKPQLMYHKMVCHTEPKYKCPYCADKFHVRRSYTRHVYSHENHDS